MSFIKSPRKAGEKVTPAEMVGGFLLILAVAYSVSGVRHHSGVEGSPDKVVESYLGCWQSGEYSKMYDMLSSSSKLVTSRWEFVRAYEKMEALFHIIDFSVYDSDINGDRAEVCYSVTTKALLGDQTTKDGVAHLLKEDGDWKIEGEETPTAKELQSGEHID